MSNRYERSSLVGTSNEPFGYRGNVVVVGDVVAVAAMIDRFVYHADVIDRRSASGTGGPVCRRIENPDFGHQWIGRCQRDASREVSWLLDFGTGTLAGGA